MNNNNNHSSSNNNENNKHRTKKACERCRKRKTKCSGELPICHNCLTHNYECFYNTDEKRRGPQKGYVRALEARIEDLQTLLESYVDNVSPEFRQKSMEIMNFDLPLSNNNNNIDNINSSNNGFSITSNNSNSIDNNSSSLMDNIDINNNINNSSKDDLDDDYINNNDQDYDNDYEYDNNNNYYLNMPNKIGHLFLEKASTPNNSDNIKTYCGESSGAYLFHKACGNNNNLNGRVYSDTLKINTNSIENNNLNTNTTTSAITDNNTNHNEIIDNLDDLLTVYIVEHMVKLYFMYFDPFLPLLNSYAILKKLNSLDQLVAVQSNHNKHIPIDEDFYTSELPKHLLYSIIAIASGFVTNHNNNSTSAVEFELLPNKDFEQSILFMQQIGDACYYKAIKTSSTLIHQPVISSVQTFLLLSIASKSSISFKSWMFSGIAIRMALEMGLHRDYICSTNKEEPVFIETYKRVWWGCYIIDRLMSVVTGRPVTINDDEYDTTVPNTDNINNNSVNYQNPEYYQATNYTNKNNIKFFVRFIQLCNLFGQVSINIYSIKSRNRYTATKLQARIYKIGEDLDNWRQDLEADWPESSNISNNTQNSNQNMYYGHCFAQMLYIFYNTLKILIYRPFLPRPEINITSFTEEYFVECCKCAEQIVLVAYNNIDNFKKVGFPFKLYPIVVCLSIYIIKASSTENNQLERQESKSKIKMCLKVIYEIRNHNPIAMCVIYDSLDMLDNHNIDILNNKSNSNSNNGLDVEFPEFETLMSQYNEFKNANNNTDNTKANNSEQHQQQIVDTLDNNTDFYYEDNIQNIGHYQNTENSNTNTHIDYMSSNNNADGQDTNTVINNNDPTDLSLSGNDNVLYTQFNNNRTQSLQSGFAMDDQYYAPNNDNESMLPIQNNNHNHNSINYENINNNNLTWDPLYAFDFNFKEYRKFK